MCQAVINCLLLLKHWMPCALAFALLKAGRIIAAKIAMIAMTTNNSISVNALLRADLEERGAEFEQASL